MAKAITPRKKKTVRVSRRTTGMKAIPTDSWNSAKLYTHYEVEGREWGTVIKDWIKKNLDRKSAAAINRLPEWRVSAFSHWATVVQLRETRPDLIPEVYNIKFNQWIDQLIVDGSAVAEEKKAEETVKKNVHVPTIQERISEQSQEACQAIEDWLEGYLINASTFDPRGLDFANHFAKYKVTQAHARKIKKYYTGWLEEAQAVADLPTAAQIAKIKDEHEADLASQLREGYAHVKKADAKKWLEALENLMSALDMIIDSAKATRKTRTKKAPSKEKMIAKLQYKDKDERYQIVSVNPLEIVDATEVWVFNTKTRKLGKYVAEQHTTIKIKGTTLQFYDEAASVQKTLRKPEETLKEFKRANKVALRKFLDNINSVEIKLNGRLNADTVILKAIK
jgi:hypothetical protein